jgi:hypothetical protein
MKFNRRGDNCIEIFRFRLQGPMMSPYPQVRVP